MMSAHVDRDRCSGCAACVSVCPAGAMRLVNARAEIDPALCRGCEACVEACPERAILIISEPSALESRIVPSTPASRMPVPASVGPARRARPWLGAALAFMAREIVPRLATSLLDVWDRRRAPTALTRWRESDDVPGRYVLPTSRAHQHRWRHGRR